MVKSKDITNILMEESFSIYFAKKSTKRKKNIVLIVEHTSPDHSTQVFITRHNGIRQIKQGWI